MPDLQSQLESFLKGAYRGKHTRHTLAASKCASMMAVGLFLQCTCPQVLQWELESVAVCHKMQHSNQIGQRETASSERLSQERTFGCSMPLSRPRNPVIAAGWPARVAESRAYSAYDAAPIHEASSCLASARDCIRPRFSFGVDISFSHACTTLESELDG